MRNNMNLQKSFVTHFENIKGIVKDKNSNLIMKIELADGKQWSVIEHSEGVTLSQNYDEKGAWKIEVENWKVSGEKEIEAVKDMAEKCKLVFVHYIKENKYGFVHGVEFSGRDAYHGSSVQDTRINVLPVFGGVSVKVQGMQKKSCSPLWMEMQEFEKSINCQV